MLVAKDQSGKVLSQGSGFLIDTSGTIVTNHHVIAGASDVVAKFPNGTYTTVQGVLGIDEKADLAVLRVSAQGLPALKVGDSRTVRVGDRIVAIGSPLALEGTVSDGIVSAIRPSGGYLIFQITAPLSPGSSGGALLNMHGEVIGVTSFTISGGQSLNFACAIDRAIQLGSSSDLKPLSSWTTGDIPRNISGNKDIDYEYGDPSELKGIEHIYVYTGVELGIRNSIVKIITKALPELTVTASPEEAEVILVYGAADPGNQVMFGLTHKNEWGKGFVIRVTADGRKRVLISFEDTATTIYERSPTGNFARAFVKAYKAANKK